jgi:putative oxidoreductase
MKALLNTISTSSPGLDTLPIRVGAGIIFAAHGSQKLFGWFGGYGLEGTASWMDSIGLAPGILMASLAGGAEFVAGLMLIVGLLVRPAALVLAITMIVAIVAVHLENGFFMATNGFEFALALLVICAALTVRGAGSFSIDKAFLSSTKV